MYIFSTAYFTPCFSWRNVLYFSAWMAKHLRSILQALEEAQWQCQAQFCLLRLLGCRFSLFQCPLPQEMAPSPNQIMLTSMSISLMWEERKEISLPSGAKRQKHLFSSRMQAVLCLCLFTLPQTTRRVTRRECFSRKQCICIFSKATSWHRIRKSLSRLNS